MKIDGQMVKPAEKEAALAPPEELVFGVCLCVFVSVRVWKWRKELVVGVKE